MADAQTTSESSKLGFMPKLILWGLVLLFGFLYLSALNRDDKQAPQTAAETGAASPAAPAAAPVTSAAPAAAAQAPATAAAPVAASKPAPAVPAAMPAQVRTPAPAPSAPQAVAAPAPKPAAPAPAAREPAEHGVSQAEAKAFARALMDEKTAQKPAAPATPPAPPAAAKTAPADAGPASESAPAQASEPAAAAAPAAGGDPALQAFEARRQQAFEEARKRWEQFGRMRPPVPPYGGYPGVYPGYYPAPGYYYPQPVQVPQAQQ